MKDEGNNIAEVWFLEEEGSTAGCGHPPCDSELWNPEKSGIMLATPSFWVCPGPARP
jgi:hypothetical protein